MAGAKTYIEFIDESVKHAKDLLEKHELLHYMIGDTPAVDGTKAQKDKIPHTHVYELSVYSTLLDVQARLHELEEKGEVPAMALVPEDEEPSVDIRKLLEAVAPETFNGKKVKTIVIDGEKMGDKDKDNLKTMLKDILSKLEEEN